ncbi:MAG: ABC transporter permease [Bacteriovoracia bacterium]
MKINPTLVGFLRKELRQTLRDPRMRIVLFVAPIMQLTLFGVAISNEVKNVRLASLHAPYDAEMRRIYDESIASGWFRPAAITGTEPYDWIQRGQADVVLVRAKGNPDIQLLVNAQNVIRAQAAENYLLSIIRRVEADQSAGSRPPPIRFDVRVLYNPTLETSVYMVPGVMCMLVCIVTILLTSMSLAREREVGTLETLISAPVKPWEIVVGKTLPFLTLGTVQLPLVLMVAVFGFGVPFRGPLLLFAVAGFVFIATTVSIGLVISTFARNQQQAMLGGFLFLFPSVLLSGLMFPLENMPGPIYALAQLNPLTHFVALLRNILLKAGSLTFFFHHLIPLALIGAATLTVGLRKFRTTL